MGGLIGTATPGKNGLMPRSLFDDLTKYYNGAPKYYRLAINKNWYSPYSSLISASSPLSGFSCIIAITWKSNDYYSAKIIVGSLHNVKLYTGVNPVDNKNELWLGLLGSDGDARSMILKNYGNDVSILSEDILPSYLSEISIS